MGIKAANVFELCLFFSDLVLPIWEDWARVRPKFDGLEPHTQHINFSLQGYFALKKTFTPLGPP